MVNHYLCWKSKTAGTAQEAENETSKTWGCWSFKNYVSDNVFSSRHNAKSLDYVSISSPLVPKIGWGFGRATKLLEADGLYCGAICWTAREVPFRCAC